MISAHPTKWQVGRDSAGRDQYQIDPESMTVVYGGFERK
jgi:hypothetical protein